MIEYALSFLAVARAGSFSGAARDTGVSKSCLSRHVSQLEADLGVALLHRTTRHVAMTEAGKKFYEACLGIDESFHEAIHALKQDFTSMQGTLRITAPVDFGIQFLPVVIQKFTDQYPKMNVLLSLTNVNEPIVEKSYDLAIRIANQLPDSTLRMIALAKFTRLICCTADYAKKHQLPDSLEALKKHRCITSVNRNPMILKPQWQFYVDDKPINFIMDHYVEMDSLLAQLDLIRSGSGIGRMPNYLIQAALDSNELVEILPSLKKPTSYVYLLYPDSVALPQKTRVFIDLLRQHISALIPA